jgi:hypothetical protein
LFGLRVDLIVVLRHQAIFVSLPILGHHDDRCRIGSLEAQRQIQQDERIRVSVAHEGYGVECDPSAE